MRPGDHGPTCFLDHLRRPRPTTPGSGGEIQLTDGLAALLDAGEVWGVEFEGELLDVGTLDGWLATNVRLAEELGRGYNPYAAVPGRVQA